MKNDPLVGLVSYSKAGLPSVILRNEITLAPGSAGEKRRNRLRYDKRPCYDIEPRDCFVKIGGRNVVPTQADCQDQVLGCSPLVLAVQTPPIGRLAHCRVSKTGTIRVESAE